LGRSRTESLGGLKEEQPEVGPKGAASGAMQVKDCRQAAPKEKQIGQSANQTPREGANQLNIAEDSFAGYDAEFRAD
jgi:hypothetical protein